MKVLLLSDVNSSHTQNWVSGLTRQGVEVALFSLTPMSDHRAKVYAGVPVETLNYTLHSGRVARKALYFRAVPKIRAYISTFQPDIVHAHYASSYGLIGALSGFHQLAVSVWGTDVYVYPRQSSVFRKLLRYTFSKARKVFSTSMDMAREAALYTGGAVEIIPFGVDVEKFVIPASKPQDVVKFATAKSLRPVYNIRVVIEAFVQMLENRPKLAAELHIAGDGPERPTCEAAAGEWIGEKIFFHGAVPHGEMPAFFRDKHVLINIPDSESFGVSVLEASASGLAVVATNAGGLPEVVKDGVSGMLIDTPNLADVGKTMEKLIDNPQLAREMGVQGRAFVAGTYRWEKCVSMQIEAYKKMIAR